MTQVWSARSGCFDFVGNFARPDQGQASRMALLRRGDTATVVFAEEFYRPGERVSHSIKPGGYQYSMSQQGMIELLEAVENGTWIGPRS
jgi:hypothetical protein